jgi:hypothetical protein
MEYTSPVSKLLAVGDSGESQRWPDYKALGLGAQHVDELIRLACDEQLMDQADGTEACGPMHAWRALAEMRAAAAVEPLVGLLRRVDEAGDDDVAQTLPALLGKFGEAVIDPLATYLAVPSNGVYARVAAADALDEVSQRYPDLRGRCVGILTDQLRQFASQDSSLNAGIIDALVGLKAGEAAEVIEQAFAAGCVDDVILGEWDLVKNRLEGHELPRDPRKPAISDEPVGGQRGPKRPAADKKKAKNRRKQERKSRKRNR